jgi:probable F420-dependent oxidoreductase
VRFGLIFANVAAFAEADGARALAAAAEEAGFDSLWTVEHVVVPSGYRSAYPYSPSGRMPGPETSPIPDPFIWLAYVAATSTTVKLATGISILPQRNPVVTAKEVATLDRLSGGRALLGVGAGWLREEFEALGVPFERRGDRLEEYIGALRALWSEEKPSFHGEFVDFTDAICRPQPVAGTVPIHIGGHTDRAARRAGRLGDGFFPGLSDPGRLGGLLATMRRAAEEAGRDPAAVEVTAGGALDVDGVRRFEDLGVDRVAVPLLAFDVDGIRRALGTFGTDVIAKVA